MRRDLDLAQDFLRSLALDVDSLDYLCNALNDSLDDLDGSELKDFLEPFLAADDVDKMLELLLMPSQCGATSSVVDSSSCAGTKVKAKRRAEDDEALTLATTEMPMCDVAREEDEKAKHKTNEDKVRCEIARAPTAHRVFRTKASQLDKGNLLDEESCLESEGFDLDVVETFFQKARSIKTGHHVMIKDQPCRVVEVGTSKIWKGPHRGCFQKQIVARSIFTGMKLEHMCPAAEDVRMAAVKRQEYTIMDIGNEGELSLLTPTYDIKADVNLPTETDGDRKLAGCIKTDFHSGKTVSVMVLSSCGVEKVVQYKATD